MTKGSNNNTKQEGAPPSPKSPKGAQKPPAKAPITPVKTPPIEYKTNIAKRINEAVRGAKPVNRSSDLVPLTHEYETLRQTLKNLTTSAKTYHSSIIGLEKARMNMVSNFASFSAKTPIAEPVGSTTGGESYVSITQAAAKETSLHAQKYQDKVVDYCIEWENIVTTRVNTEMKETKKLNEKLNHYQNKIEGLRTKVNPMNSNGKNPPKRLTEKLDRNEKKLDQAWRQHERSASKLCNLLEEVTQRGWKDLYPLIKASMEWEVERACGVYDIVARLPSVTETLTETFDQLVQLRVGDESSVPVALADYESGSETTGPYEEEESKEEDSAEEEYQVPPVPPNLKKFPDKAPKSPKGVAQI